MNNNKKALLALLLAICMVMMSLLTGCSGGDTPATGTTSEPQDVSDDSVGPEIGLAYESKVKLEYATQFDLYNYEGGYVYIQIHDGEDCLVIPEGKEAPEELESDVIQIHQPLENIYLGATASMALFDALGALDQITMTELKANGWTVENAKKAMEDGKIQYAGKYNEPDYEMILGGDCDLAIESTMIYHSPEVKEMLEEIGIPVLVDRSSYEENPLGRTEWIKLYGAITGKEDVAESFFEGQKDVIAELNDFENTEKTVAFFYVTTDGKVVVRRSADYVPTMIQMAGGRYIFDNLSDESGRSSISMTMESFYDQAADADYIVYNGSIDGTVKSIADLIEKDSIFKDFKAVKDGNVYNTGSSMYQRTDVITNMIMDFHKLLTEDNPSDLQFMTKME